MKKRHKAGVAKLNTYEGLYIFDERLKEEELKQAVDQAHALIEKHGGSVLGSKTLGRRTFARQLKKRQAGIYVRTVFNMDPEKISPLLASYKLSEVVFRVQICRGDSKSLEFVAQILEGADEGAEKAVAAE